MERDCSPMPSRPADRARAEGGNLYLFGLCPTGTRRTSQPAFVRLAISAFEVLFVSLSQGAAGDVRPQRTRGIGFMLEVAIGANPPTVAQLRNPLADCLPCIGS